MAHGVRQSGILKAHQTLHGYADGHRQLASSVTLRPNDIKTMLVLSDISGPGARIEDAGYLTGYPLSESKFYALARTWAAPELPRPGCVWTHTILVDFADLAALDDPMSLLLLFRRPTGSNFTEYGAELLVPPARFSPSLNAAASDFARRLLAGLYGRPLARVVATKPTQLDADPIAMALWAQQWPRLRRAFRFCTFAAADRSSEGNIFDLQILPSQDRSVRQRFQDAVDVAELAPATEAWVDDAVSDLTRSDQAGLRAFLRRIGGDVDSGREAFAPLCRLHVLVEEFGTNPQAIDTAVSLLSDELVSAQARTARGMIATLALDKVDQLGDGALDFLDQNLEFAEADAVSRNGARLGRELWKRKPERFAEMLDGGSLQRSVSTSGLGALAIDEMIAGIVRLPGLAAPALAHRPELVSQPEFWSADAAPMEAAFAALRGGSHDLQTLALRALITARRDDLAGRAVGEFGAIVVLTAVADLFDDPNVDRRGIAIWLAASAADPSIVAQFLTNRRSPSWSLLGALAHRVRPEAVPNGDGIDPWLVSARTLEGPPSGNTALFLCAYLLARALGSRTHNPGELAQFAFEPIHVAAAALRLPDEAWWTLEPRLPWGLSWFSSDRCPRIRLAIADLFVERDLPPQMFAEIAKDDRLFALTAESMARNTRGRRFLKQVGSWIQGNSDQSSPTRVRIIESLTD
jgi:hypothetical protein